MSIFIFKKNLESFDKKQLTKYDPKRRRGRKCPPSCQLGLIKVSHLIIYFNCENIYLFQSSSKPFTYSVCLNELGANTVHQYVGQEPSGRMFNELSLDFNSKFLID
jgi:hypothetical protein